jgi:hypothetical protein
MANKKIQISATEGWNEKYGGLEGSLYIRIALQLFEKYRCDMYIFEYVPNKKKYEDGQIKISMNGYNVDTEEYIETKVVQTLKESLPIEKFYFKLDDYGDKFVGTFLFTDEY